MFSAETRRELLWRSKRHVKELARQGPAIVGRSAQDAAEVVEDRNPALARSHDDAREDFLGAGARGVPVAPEDFSVDHRRTDRLVGPASGVLESRGGEEGKDLRPVDPKV